MTFTYSDADHCYRLDGIAIPSLTGMLSADGCSDHLANVPAATLEAKRQWGSALHLALQKCEYGFGITDGFQEHCCAWLDVMRKMKWQVGGADPIWKNCELPALAQVDGFVFGFTPDRAAPEAVVELKGTYSPHFSHGIQTALQVIGLGYDRRTPRYICYFDRDGLRKLHTCGDSILRDGNRLNVWDECDRLIFEHAMALEAA